MPTNQSDSLLPVHSRRQFLARAALGLAGGGLAAAAASRARAQESTTVTKELKQPEPPTKRVGWAIAGIGHFATGQILPNIRMCEKTRVAGFITRDPAGKGQQWAARFGVDPRAVVAPDNIRALEGRDDIQVVYVITPNALHKDYVLAALAAGKHVLCEKPFAPTPGECEEMIAAARKADRRLMIAYRAHFEPHNLAAIDAIRQGKAGKIRLITSEHVRVLKPEEPQDAWRAKKALAGGGSLVDIGVYALNGARYLSGEEPVRVTGRSFSTPGDPRFTEVEETMLFQIEFPSGLVAQCLSSYGVHNTKRFRAFGENGWIDLDPATEYHGNQLHEGREGERLERVLSEGNQFASMMDHFSECVQTGRTPKTPGEEGLRDVRYMTAMYESARSNGSPVTVGQK